MNCISIHKTERLASGLYTLLWLLVSAGLQGKKEAEDLAGKCNLHLRNQLAMCYVCVLF